MILTTWDGIHHGSGVIILTGGFTGAPGTGIFITDTTHAGAIITMHTIITGIMSGTVIITTSTIMAYAGIRLRFITILMRVFIMLPIQSLNSGVKGQTILQIPGLQTLTKEAGME